MKKAFWILILTLLILTSCSVSKDLCYYGFFSDQAYMVLYSEAKNTVYDIRLPLDSIVSWGLGNSNENIPNAIRSYIGINEEGFMYGNARTIEALCEINAVVKADPECLNDVEILNNITRICNADLSSLAQLVASNAPSYVSIDASGFTDDMDLESGRRYFRNWIKQVVGE